MIFLFLIYGLSFLILGIAMSLQAFARVRALPRRAAAFLSLFGLLHGAYEWLTMFQLMEHRGLNLGLSQFLASALPILLFVSFLFLLAFGIDYMAAQKRWTRRAKVTFGVVVAIWVPVLVLRVLVFRAEGSSEAAALELLLRYGVGLVACSLAAVALWPSATPKIDGLYRRYERYLKLSSVVMGIFAVASGLFIARVRSETVESLFFGGPSTEGLVLIVSIRSACAALLTLFLSLAFFIEVSYIEVTLSLQKRRDEFAFAVIHDLRASLSTITLASALLLKAKPGEDQERFGKLVRLIRSGAMSMGQLISDLAMNSPLEVGKLVLRKGRCDARALVGEFVEQMSTAVVGHTLNARLPEGPVWVEADSVRIEQVLTNLLSNATKYSYPGTSIEIELKTESSRAVVSVTNRGVGIQPEEEPLLFTRYYRAPSARERATGFGLGLFIVKSIVDAHQGEVSVKSIPRETTTFSFSLPLAEEVSEEARISG